MSRKRVVGVRYPQEIIDLADSLTEKTNLESIPTETLFSLQNYLSETTPQLIRQSKCVVARKYSRISENVKAELESRQTLQLKPLKPVTQFKHPKLDQFDQETLDKIRVVEERAEKMDREVIEVWESQLKSRYYVPSPSIAEMRSRAERLKERGDIPAADKLNEDADQFEKEDRINMEESYEKDLQTARNEARNKCIADINKIKRQRAQLRQQLENEIKSANKTSKKSN